MRRILDLVALLTLSVLAIECARASDTTKTAAAVRWEPAIAEFERQDKAAPPPQGAIVFVGSSSIVRWDLRASFPDLECINRGFGGSYMEDAARYAERIVVPYHPRLVVVYAGDNDIAHGQTPAEVAAAGHELVKIVEVRLPDTRIVFVSIKPSPQRWHQFGKMQEANRLIAAMVAKDPRLRFVDVTAAMLGADGRPRPELFVDDGLHLTAAGYALWASLLRPELALPQAPAAVPPATALRP